MYNATAVSRNPGTAAARETERMTVSSAMPETRNRDNQHEREGAFEQGGCQREAGEDLE